MADYKSLRKKIFNKGIVYIWKNHFPAGTYNKLKDKKYRPFQIMKHINNNAYVVGL